MLSRSGIIVLSQVQPSQNLRSEKLGHDQFPEIIDLVQLAGQQPGEADRTGWQNRQLVRLGDERVQVDKPAHPNTGLGATSEITAEASALSMAING